MRKILSCAAAAGIAALSLVGLVGCGGTSARNKYVIDAEYFPEAKMLSAQMTVTVPNLTDNALGELKFQLYPNAYREGAKYAPVSELYAPAAYYNGASYGGIDVAEVRGAENYRICGEDENILSAELSSPLYPDEEVTLGFTFTVSLAEINHRLGVGEHAVNLANFYPVLCSYGADGFNEYVYSSNGDPFVSECADYEVTLTVPEDYTAAYGGAGERVAENGKAAYHVVAENARDIAFVLGKEFQTVSAKSGGCAVDYVYFADENPQAALDAAAESLAYFSEAFGEYPYPHYTVVQTDFPYGGMEYPMLSMVSASLRADDIASVVVHETAHQWWYVLVGSNQFEHAWQDEGLAEYSTALFMEKYPGYGIDYRETVAASESSYRAFFSVYSQLHGGADTTMDRPLTSFSGEYEYRNIAYDKGVILFDRVRSVLGERRFLAALKRYAEKYAYRLASPADMISCFGSAGAEALFRSFTEGKCVI